MKHLLIFSLLTPLLINCAASKDIRPYEAPEQGSMELPVGTAAADAVFQELLDDDNGMPEEKAVTAAIEEPQKMVHHANNAVDLPKEKPEEQPKAAPAPSARRQISSSKNGYYTFSRDCVMRNEPNSGSVGSGTVPAGKKLWLDVHDKQWLKAYKKAGVVYVPSNCVK